MSKRISNKRLSLQNKPVEMGFKRYKNHQLSYVDSVVAVIENTWTFKLHVYKNKTLILCSLKECMIILKP